MIWSLVNKNVGALSSRCGYGGVLIGGVGRKLSMGLLVGIRKDRDLRKRCRRGSVVNKGIWTSSRLFDNKKEKS